MSFEEKPSLPLLVSMGIYVLEPSVLEHVPADQHFDIPELIHRLLAARAPVGCYAYDGFWLDIGRHDDYERAVELWEGNSTTLKG
jgi:mannose-1-phosphate guanylyltransferase